MTSETQQKFSLPHSDSVLEAVKEVFTMTCGTEATLSDADLSDKMLDGVVIAVISIVGDVNWSVFLGLPRSTSEQLAKSFCGFDVEFESDDMGDVVGELTNILAGTCKQILDKRGVDVEISLPSVMRVEGIEILVQRESTSRKLFFESSVGCFWAGVVSGKNPGFVA